MDLFLIQDDGSIKYQIEPRVGILKQNAKYRYSGIPGFEVKRNSTKIFVAQLFFKHHFISALYTSVILPELQRC
jgi:hypothetical protein